MNAWMIRLISLILTVLSPELKQGLRELLDNLDEKAKKTRNPWDDILVNLLRNLLLGE